mgnify:FL=1
MKIIILFLGLILIGLIIWWFFGKFTSENITATVKDNQQSIDIIVNGGYSPENIVLEHGVPAVLNFTRKDASSCLDRVVFSDFGINRTLIRNKTELIEIDTSKPGEFEWACGMDMFHGKMIIK